MRKEKDCLILGSLVSVLLALLTLFVFSVMFQQSTKNNKVQKTSVKQTSSSSSSKPATKKETATVKSAEAKQAVMIADATALSNLGLYYDYASLSLEDTIKAYMAENGIADDQVAFSYKDLASGQTASMNDTELMTAGSTYKLPLNMLVVDAVAKGKISMDERFDITNTDYEYIGEHNNYVAAFDGAMSISDMQKYSLVYSENTPAYALSERIGGMDKAYTMFGRYGKSKSKEVKTIRQEGNKTTTDYCIQVLDYLWKHKDKYSDLIGYLEEAFPQDYYHALLPDLVVAQKPGYVREALNVGAIVQETTPYIVAIYTKGLGGATESDSEINGVGLYELEQLCYVVNEWHRVNMNP